MKINLPHFIRVFFVSVFLLISCSSVLAKKETVNAIAIYEIYGSSLKSDNLQSVISDWESKSKASFERCMAVEREPYESAGCSKQYVIDINPHPVLGTNYTNGETIWYEAKVETFFYYYRYSGNYTETKKGGALGIEVHWSCPKSQGDSTYVLNTSGSEENKTVWCEKVVVESCPVGNPIDVYTGVKYEFDVDYSSPNKLLNVERRYVSQHVGWAIAQAPRMLFLEPNQSTTTDNLFPQIENSCLDSASILLTRYKDPYDEPNVKESYYKNICIKMLNKLTVPVIDVWLRGQKFRYLKDGNAFYRENDKGKKSKFLATDDIDGIGWILEESNGIKHYFDYDGSIVKTTHPSGGYVFYQFENNLLTSQTDHAGRAVYFIYNENNRLNSVILPNNETIDYEYITDDKTLGSSYWLLSQVSWPNGRTRSYSYNESENILGSSNEKYLTGKFDSYGNRIGNYHYQYEKAISTEGFDGTNKREVVKRRYSYVTTKNSLGTEETLNFNTELNGKKLLTGKKQAAGVGSTIAYSNIYYNLEGLVTEKRDFNGNKVQFAYEPDTNKKIVVVSGIPSNNGNNYTHEGAILPDTATKVSYKWDNAINKVVKIAAPNRMTTYLYHGMSDPLDNTQLISCVEDLTTQAISPFLCRVSTQTTSDTNGEQGISANIIQDAKSTHFSYDYNERGQLKKIIHLPDNNVILENEYYLDSTDNFRIGDLKSTQNALGHKVTYVKYNDNGNPVEILDENGVMSKIGYDFENNVISFQQSTQIFYFEYDLNGNMDRITLPGGTIIRKEYDGAGRLKKIIDGLANQINYEYDGENNLLLKSISTAQELLIFQEGKSYDALSRIKKIEPDSGAYINYSYDKEGNVTQVKNALNNATISSYDALNRLEKTVDPDTAETRFEYNTQDLITKVIDGENKATEYEYNAFGELTQLNSPDTGITTFTYDSAGNLLTKTDARGVTVTFTYDALNRVLTQSYSDNSENITYTYDDTTNGNIGIGRLTRVTDQSGSTDYVYNAFGQVTQETRVIAGNTYVTQYHFDSAGRQTGVTYPNGRKMVYSFDSLGRVNGVNVEYQNTTKVLASNVDYLPFGPMKGFTYGNNKTLTQTYDLDYRLTDKTVSGITQLSYGYDVTNNINAITNGLDTNQNQVFTYDKLSRLLTATGGYNDLIFTYDKVGNRLTKTEGSNSDTYNYATDSHRLTSITGNSPRTFTHDAVGNTLIKDDLTFTYNQQNRMKTASKAGMNASYVYNFKGERSRKLVNGVTTEFIYDLNGQLIAEADDNGAIQREYVYLNGQRIATYHNGTIYFVHTNHLDTPIALTDETGTVQWKAHYTPFGQAIVEVNNINQNIRFPGQYYDQESGLHYNYFRDYDPEIGRYIQSDPIGLNGGINTYGYAYQNSVNNVDPDGRFVVRIIAGFFFGMINGAINFQMNANNPCLSTKEAFWAGFAGGFLGGVTLSPVGGSIVSGSVTSGLNIGLSGGTSRQIAMSSIQGGFYSGITGGFFGRAARAMGAANGVQVGVGIGAGEIWGSNLSNWLHPIELDCGCS